MLNISNYYLILVALKAVRLCFCVCQVPDLDCVVVRCCGEDSLVFRRTEIKLGRDRALNTMEIQFHPQNSLTFTSFQVQS